MGDVSVVERPSRDPHNAADRGVCGWSIGGAKGSGDVRLDHALVECVNNFASGSDVPGNQINITFEDKARASSPHPPGTVAPDGDDVSETGGRTGGERSRVCLLGD